MSSFAKPGNPCQQALIVAEEKFSIGLFDEAKELLTPCLTKTKSRRLSAKAYRLIAYIALIEENEKEAMQAISRMLELYPTIEIPDLAPTGFKNLVEKKRLTMEKPLLVTSVSKKREDLHKAPATVISISQEEILRRGYTDLEAFFHDLPGFDISRTNSIYYSHLYQRGYRSDSPNRTLLLVDGVEENDLFTHGIRLSRQYALSNIKRVEVVYGPASTIYGPNAFLGVINIITKEPQELTRDTNVFGAHIHGTVGEWRTGLGDITLSLRSKKNPDISFSCTGRYFQSEEMDLSDFLKSNFPHLNRSWYNHSYFEIKDTIDAWVSAAPTLFTRLSDTVVMLSDAGISRAQQLDSALYNDFTYDNPTKDFSVNAKLKVGNFIFGVHHWTRSEGTTLSKVNPHGSFSDGTSIWAPRQTSFFGKMQWDYTKRFSIINNIRYKIHDYEDASAIISNKGYYNNKLSMRNLIDNQSGNWYKTNYYQNSQQFREELISYFYPNPRFDLVSGVEYRSSFIQCEYLKFRDGKKLEIKHQDELPEGNHSRSNEFAFYSQTSFKPFKKVTVSLGGRIDYYNEGFSRDLYDINSRAAIVYYPGPFVFKSIYSSAFKEPSNWAKYSTSGSRKKRNPSLKPEKVHNFDFSGAWKPNKSILLEVVGYLSQYSNAIGTVLSADSSTLQHANTGKRSIKGVQTQASYTFKNVSLFSNSTITYAKQKKDSEASFESIRDIARFQANLGCNALLWKALNINLRLNYVGKRKTGQDKLDDYVEPIYPTIDPIFLTNLTITHSFSSQFKKQPFFKTFHPRIQCIINNIFDTKAYCPGIRLANNKGYPTRVPQNERQIIFRLFLEY